MNAVTITKGTAPLLIAFPHGGTDLAGLDECFVSPWLARCDTDWWIADLYSFAAELDVTTVATKISRSVIDCNRDPSGASLYPGQATTGLCPETTFDGLPLYPIGAGGLDPAEIACRRAAWFDPYHAALTEHIERLQTVHPRVVLLDAHSIRSRIARLFTGQLPTFNIGTNSGLSCAPGLAQAVAQVCERTGDTWVLDGRFKGGWTTRHYGRPDRGVHAIQLELAMNAYLHEPVRLEPGLWPTPLDPIKYARLRAVLTEIVQTCLTFAKEPA